MPKARGKKMIKKLTTARAGVVCQHIPRKKQFILNPDEKEPIVFVKAGTEVIELPLDYTVLSQDGEVIAPEQRFYRTVSTIDPYHIILDML